MRRHPTGLLLAATVLLAAAIPAHANVSFSTHDGATNAAGQPVDARAEFTVNPDAVIVRLTNTTPDLKGLGQALSGLSFSVLNKPANGQIGFTRGRVRVLKADGSSTSADLSETGWTLVTHGNTYTLKAPGKRNLIVPDDANPKFADVSEGQSSRPVLVGQCVFQIVIPGIGLTDDLIGVKFLWGDQIDDALLDPTKSLTRPSAPDPSHMIGDELGTPGDQITYVPSQSNNDVLNESGDYRGDVGAAGYVPHDVGSGGDVGDSGTSSSSGTTKKSTGGSTTQPSTPTDQGFPLTSTGQTDPNTPVPEGFTLTAPSDRTGPNPEIPLTLSDVPEPATIGLVLGGLALALARRRR